MKKRMSWLALSAIAGSAFIVAAVMLLVMTSPGRTPTASAQEECTVTVTKVADPSPTVTPGENITYTITVTATGTVEDCDAVTITDNIPANTTFVDASTVNGPPDVEHGSPDVTSVTWGPAQLGGTPWELTLTVQVNDDVADGTVITNTATPSGDNINVPGSATVTVEVPEQCQLSITKEADNDEVVAGDEITYDINVTNVGDVGCTNIDVTDELDDTNLTCVSASVDDRDDLHFDQDDIDSSCDDNNVEWQSTSGVLDPGDSIDLQLVAQTDADLEEGDHVSNEACVTANTTLDDEAGAAVGEVCATERTRIEEGEATPTPTPTATSTPIPPAPTPIIIVVPATTPVPTAAPLPALKAPPSGTGPQSGGTSWALPIGLGISGLALVAISGGVLVKRRMR